MVHLFLIALCCSAISFTITTTSIFLWLREAVSKLHHKLEELIHCPWCLSHYIAAGALLVTDVVDYVSVSQYYTINFIIALFAVVCLSGIFHYVLLRAYKPVAENMARRNVQKLRNNNVN